MAGQAGPNDANHLASRQTAALRQKLPLAGSKSNFRFTPESRLNSEIAACPESANERTRFRGRGLAARSGDYVCRSNSLNERR